MNAPVVEALEVTYRRGRLRANVGLVVAALLFFFIYSLTSEGGLFGLELRGRKYRALSDIGVPVIGLVFLFAFAQWAGAMFRRGVTLHAGPGGLTLSAGSQSVGPFKWSEIAEFEVVRKKAWVALHILFKQPDQSLAPFKGKLRKYRSLAVPSPHLILAPNLLNVSAQRAVSELDKLRQLHS